MKKKLFVVLLAIVCAVLTQISVFADENAAAYLKEYYDISFEGEVSAEEYNAALTALGADPLEVDSLTLADAVVGAIRLAGMEELAKVYASADFPADAASVLAQIGITTDETLAPYIACALDRKLVSQEADFAGPLTADTAASMLYRAAEMSGKGRRYIGRLSDENFLMELRSFLNSVAIFDDEKLSEAGIEIIVSEATTGFSLKYDGYDAHFLEENTLRYGHDSITHLIQLAALMKTGGFDAYVQVEPKVSVYEYMLDWGEPGAPTPTYAVSEVEEGRYFAFATEFDVAFEFDTAAQKEGFHNLIESFAKKYDSVFDADGNYVKPLIASSWWQPLYFSRTEMENEEFMPLVDNVITSDDSFYSVHSFSLPENTDAIIEAAEQIDPELSVEPAAIYVNPAFYRYITGEDYQ